MDILNIIAMIVYGVGMYMLGKRSMQRMIGDKMLDAMVAKASVPIGVVEEIEGHYYVYEKDTVKFMGQAATLEDLPKKLLENKIGLALLMYPEKSSEIYWCINGKLKAVNEG